MPLYLSSKENKSVINSKRYGQKLRTVSGPALLLDILLDVSPGKETCPDVLQTLTAGGVPVQWIDDNADMRIGDVSGDLVDDCTSD